MEPERDLWSRLGSIQREIVVVGGELGGKPPSKDYQARIAGVDVERTEDS